MDVVVDPIDGRLLLANGRPGAISMAAVAPRGSMWAPTPAVYMGKIVVDKEAANGPLLDGVVYDGNWAETHSLILRCETKTRRFLTAEHYVEDE